MSIEKVREFFKSAGIDGRIKEFGTSSATVALAAGALQCEPCRIAKTISFAAGESAVLIVCAGDTRIDNSKFKAEFGGVCPFAVNDGVIICLDESLKRFDTVFPACGSSNSAIELTVPELEKYSSFQKWVDVCKGWRKEESL